MLTEIRIAGLKGFGLFARKHIAQGTRILSERPLIMLKHGENQNQLFTKAQALSPGMKEELLALSSYPGTGIGRAGRIASTISWTVSDVVSRRYSAKLGTVEQNLKILDIWRSNGFRINSRNMETALFPTIARINHECIPNSQANFHEETDCFHVHAMKDIASGEELSLSYLPVDGLALREERTAKLSEGYGFLCQCPACHTGSERGNELEKRRIEIRRRLADFALRGGGEEGELKLTLELVNMLEEEGHRGMEIANMWLGISKMQRTIGRESDAAASMVRGLEYQRLCTGENSLEAPNKFVAWTKEAAAEGA